MLLFRCSFAKHCEPLLKLRNEMKWNEMKAQKKTGLSMSPSTLNWPINFLLVTPEESYLTFYIHPHFLDEKSLHFSGLSMSAGTQGTGPKSSSRLIEQPMLCWYRSSREVLCVADYLQSHKFEILESEVANVKNRLFHKRIQDADD